ncbi:MAG: Crp/Fnr family transcriptional regulator [Acutalibacteraceae bacterium]|nr:Crp/Fnr family transcriptional regulator [Bacillota bacterium]
MNHTFLLQTALFRGCPEDDLPALARHLEFRTVSYPKEAVVLNEGSQITEIGLVLSGCVQMEHNDIWGNKSILGMVQAGGVFAEAYACMPGEPMMIDVIAKENTTILFLSVPKLFTPCNACQSQNRVIQNLVQISAHKNLQLSRRTLHTSPKTIRERLLSYFSYQVMAQGSRHIRIPFDRQQLADYLNVDRSALSKELGKMKQDGLITYRKNEFVIHQPL